MPRGCVGFCNAANVYVHWPYCRRKCNYCNFNKYVEAAGADRERMVACLVREWATVRAEEGITKASTVFFGGGTPSLMDPGDVEKILRRLNLTQKGLWRNLHI